MLVNLNIIGGTLMGQEHRFSLIKFVVSMLITAGLVATLIFGIRQYLLAKKISEANSNAKQVSQAAEQWLSGAKLSQGIDGEKLIFKSEYLGSKKSNPDDKSRFTIMDLTNYINGDFYGNWCVVVDAKTLKIDYVLWSKETITDGDMKKLDSVSTQTKNFKKGNVIGCCPIKEK